jgi:hypothetical protein
LNANCISSLTRCFVQGWSMKKEEIALKIFLSTPATAKDWTCNDAEKAAQACDTMLKTICALEW